MTDPTTHAPASSLDPEPGSAVAATQQLRARVVREARRETWFVVNDGEADLTIIPVDVRADAALRRVEVNGEAAEFSSDDTHVLVRPRRPLRAGAGTIVICHFR